MTVGTSSRGGAPGEAVGGARLRRHGARGEKESRRGPGTARRPRDAGGGDRLRFAPPRPGGDPRPRGCCRFKRAGSARGDGAGGAPTGGGGGEAAGRGGAAGAAPRLKRQCRRGERRPAGPDGVGGEGGRAGPGAARGCGGAGEPRAAAGWGGEGRAARPPAHTFLPSPAEK